MSKLLGTIGAALRDARRAEALASDGHARRELGADPARMLRMFELGRPVIDEEAGVRVARAAQWRDAGVRDARARAAMATQP